MGIRESLNKNPAVTTGATAAIIVLALAFIIWQLVGTGPSIQTESWYTIDDGKTWFADELNKYPPFTHEGQEAVRAHVYTCDGGNTKFVAYLERYNPEIKAKIEAEMAKPEEERSGGLDDWRMSGTEVKKPGETKWVRQMDHDKSGPIMEPKCPDGTLNNIEPVLP